MNLGKRSERLAAAYLVRNGWRLLNWNYRFRQREIDIIARRGEVVAFVEVKGRSGTGFGHPLEAITWRKRLELRTVAEVWIERYGKPGEVYRYDAISVYWNRREGPILEHFEDAWRA